jgi:hypothetical protein
MERRMRRLTAALLAAILVAAVAASGPSAALASRTADHAAAARSSSPEVAGTLSEVPWSSIGPGWILAKWLPHPRARHPSAFLEVVSPIGARYVLYRISLFDQLVDWSGDGQRVLLEQMTQQGPTILRTLDVRTGVVEQSFRVPGTATGRFSRPAGRAIFATANVDTHAPQLARYTFAGALQRTFPETISGLGRWNGWWTMSPDGTQLAVGFDRGLAVLGNDGSLIAALHAAGQRDCSPTRWWTPTVILARCLSGTPNPRFRLVEFSASWSAPRALTRYPIGPDLGDLDAWHVGASVFVQASSGCGPGWLGELHGSTVVMVDVPPFGPQPGNGEEVLGATGTSIALLTGNECSGQQSVAWYTPATHSVLQVLGPPLSGGNVVDVLVYRSPTS